MKGQREIEEGVEKMQETTENNELDGMPLKLVPEQTYQMGTDSDAGMTDDNEGPTIEVELPAFYISETTVTNAAFHRFVLDTGYITEAERLGTSFVFYGLIEEENKEKLAINHTDMSWWVDVADANWRKPEGPGSSIKNRMDHPVVHVTWNDAKAYAAWADGRLPTEAEWEAAARGGHSGRKYPWGDDFRPGAQYLANIWQGSFPTENTTEDGYKGTAPAAAFYENDFGIKQMIGNVWEWCLNPTRIDLSEFQSKSSETFVEENQGYQVKDHATRGGSFLCHDSYCNRYRVAARNGNSGNSSSSNMSFRYVVDID